MLVRDVLPRDGFQDLDYHVPTEVKVAVIRSLYDAGLRWIEVTSMVRADWVPQFADAEEVLAAAADLAGLRRSAFTPNRRGVERALTIGVEEVSLTIAATDELSRANFARDRDVMVDEVLAAAADARSQGVAASVTVGGAFGCPYEGEVALATVIDLAERIAASGVTTVFLADTIGTATVATIDEAFTALRARLPAAELGVHLHGGRGALDRVDAAVDAGATVIDSACAGLGGCPFVPDAPGNVPTEAVVERLAERGLAGSLDPAAVYRAAATAARLLEEARPGAIN